VIGDLSASLARSGLRLFGRLPPRLRRFLVRLWAPSYTVGAICVVEDGAGRVLLVRHLYRRHWGAPGGLLDRGELPADAAVREVAEEVGLEVEIAGEPRTVVWPAYQRIDFVFRSSPVAGCDPGRAAPSSTEIVEVRWFTADRLPVLQPDTAAALRSLGWAVEPPPEA
jgi:8-oxo-dGTP pyrophosphatase MutT (NUDIX family)